jgi:uncharacterized protein (DUF2164 family)
MSQDKIPAKITDYMGREYDVEISREELNAMGGQVSASETPLTDSAQCHQGPRFHWTLSDACRAIERRLNAAVEALEKVTDAINSVQDWSETYVGESLDEAQEAIANARKPINEN